MNAFVQKHGRRDLQPVDVHRARLVMDYYDGNTVTRCGTTRRTSRCPTTRSPTRSGVDPGALTWLPPDARRVAADAGRVPTPSDAYAVRLAGRAPASGTVINRSPTRTYDDCSNKNATTTSDSRHDGEERG